jgi:MFS family permease
MSLITPRLSKKFNRKWIILSGIALLFFANSFLGSAKYFFLPEMLWCICIGMVLLGIAANMFFCLILPELVEISTKKIGEKNNELLNDKISGIFGTFFCLGFFMAPLYSGAIQTLVSFRISCTSCAGMDIVISIIYALLFIAYRHKIDKELT